MEKYTLYEKRLTQALSGGAAVSCPPDIRRRLLDRARKTAEDYQSENPEAPWEEVEQFLGDPKELAQTMLEGEDQAALEQYSHKKRLRQRIILFAMAALLAASFCLLVYAQFGRPIYITIETTLTEVSRIEEEPIG